MNKEAASNSHKAQQNLRWSPYLASIALATAAILAFWIPFNTAFLCLAAALGAVSFVIQWQGVRHKANLGLLIMALWMVGFMFGREFLVAQEARRSFMILREIQFMAVSFFIFAALHLLFRARLQRDLDQ